MGRISRRARRWAWVTLLVATILVVWSVRILGPKRDRCRRLQDQIVALQVKEKQILSEGKKVRRIRQEQVNLMQQLAKYEEDVVPGQSPEEVNAQVQRQVQDFLEKEGIKVVRYRDVGTTKWKDYVLTQVEFQVETTTTKLAKLLDFLQNGLRRFSRVQTMQIRYRHRKDAELSVIVTVATLFVNEKELAPPA